jgi:hypothetical protein
MPEPRNARLAREPRMLHRDALEAAGARILDPSRTPIVGDERARPTAYVANRLMVAKGERLQEQVQLLRAAAETLSWSVRLDPEPAKARNLPLGVRTVHIGGAQAGVLDPPDAWALLQTARHLHGRDALRGVDLDHVVSTRPVEPNPWDIPHSPDPSAWIEPDHWDIPHPWSGPDHWDIPHPDNSSDASAGLLSYGQPGFGGRQPIAYAGPRPTRYANSAIKGRRPVVAILDTGCYPHYWFDGGVVKTDVKLRGHAIGYTDPATDPELHGDLGGPFVGSLDRSGGHGTFCAGLVHQACPDAQILAWRGIPATEPLVESEWLTTLAQIVELVRLDRAGSRGGHPIDVLSLSMGYYHENAADNLLDPILWGILDELGRLGVIVVCSAGNDATDRPSYPAAFAPWSNGKGPVHRRRDRVPVVSVGALNPNTSDALFTNAGPWVRSYAPGASLMSTMPPFRGGLQPTAKTWVDHRLRESVDPDDYSSGRRSNGELRGGFGLWSGTSFSAPLMAGSLAAALSKELINRPNPARAAGAAVRRGWRAVERLTDMQRPE